MQYTWKIGGEAGFGIMTTGLLFSKIAARRGYDIFDFVEYPSLIRGGHNAYEVAVSDAPVSSLKKEFAQTKRSELTLLIKEAQRGGNREQVLKLLEQLQHIAHE